MDENVPPLHPFLYPPSLLSPAPFLPPPATIKGGEDEPEVESAPPAPHSLRTDGGRTETGEEEAPNSDGNERHCCPYTSPPPRPSPPPSSAVGPSNTVDGRTHRQRVREREFKFSSPPFPASAAAAVDNLPPLPSSPPRQRRRWGTGSRLASRSFVRSPRPKTASSAAGPGASCPSEESSGGGGGGRGEFGGGGSSDAG